MRLFALFLAPAVHALGLADMPGVGRLTDLPGLGRVTLLCDLPTPALLIDVDAASDVRDLLERGRLPDFAREELGGAVYMHARVTQRLIDLTRASATAGELGGGRYHRDASYAIAALDVTLPPGGAVLVMGLNNHWDADYYWARSAGKNSNRPAPGIGIRASDGRAQVVRLSEAEAVAESGGGVQPNDGKWSEWVEYLKAGDEVDLVMSSPAAAIQAAPGGRVFGVSRAGRPLGAEPYVCGEWPSAGLCSE